MNTQINLRLQDSLLDTAKSYADKHGYGNVQELIKESLREKLFEEEKLSRKEITLVKALVEASNKQGFYRTEKELFDALRKHR
jgi:hypothetical protein